MDEQQMKISTWSPRFQNAVEELFRDFVLELAPPDRYSEFETYVEKALNEDLRNIDRFYLSKGQVNFWIATIGEDAIGMIGLEERSIDTAEIRRMAVDKRYRRRGIGTRLIAFVEEEAARLGFKELVLSTSELQRPAIRLYEAHGYHCIGKEVAANQTDRTVGTVMRFYYRKSIGDNSDLHVR